jgi:predicted nucleic acid-binding protein
MEITRIFIDSGAFVGTDLPRDQYHQRSREAWEQLSNSSLRLYSSDAVFQETMALLHHRAGTELAIRWADAHIDSKLISWLPINSQVQKSALPWMKKFADQALSFVDATSFVLMRRENIRHVFTFDHHFAAAGFRLWPG